MKRNTLLLTALLPIAALSACSDGEEAENSTSTEAESAETEKTVEDSESSSTASTEASADSETVSAVAELSGTTEESKVTGEAIFTQDEEGKVSVVITVENGIEGTHGIHIHENNSCEAAEDTPGKAAGGHWDITGSDHGEPNAEVSHLGDMGNIVIDAEGNGTLEVSIDEWTLSDGAETDVIEHAIILHADEDDFGQPTGNAGGRVGCGLIAEATA